MKLQRQDLALLLLRLPLAAVFLFHGSQKLFGLFGGYGIEDTAGFMESIGLPAGTLMAVLAGGAEFIGGLALLTGLGLRLLSVPLTFTMLVAAFLAHSGFDGTQGGMEYPLVLAAAVAALGIAGPGRLALGALRTEARRLQTT